MDNTTLFDSVMLDDADIPMLSADLARISAMIERAARAVEPLIAPTTGRVPKPDEQWQAMSPSTDENPPCNGADVVPVKHEIAENGRPLSGPINVPRVVA